MFLSDFQHALFVLRFATANKNHDQARWLQSQDFFDRGLAVIELLEEQAGFLGDQASNTGQNRFRSSFRQRSQVVARDVDRKRF